MRKMPANPDVEYEYCPLNSQMMPRLYTENSRSYWLRYYNEKYEPVRAKNAKVVRNQAITDLANNSLSFFQTTEAVLARMSEQLELMKQICATIDARIKDQVADLSWK